MRDRSFVGLGHRIPVRQSQTDLVGDQRLAHVLFQQLNLVRTVIADPEIADLAAGLQVVEGPGDPLWLNQ